MLLGFLFEFSFHNLSEGGSLAAPGYPVHALQRLQVIEAMAPDEMDQDHLQKSGREVLDQIRAKKQEISAKEQEIKEVRREIRELRGEIREKEAERRGVEKEIASAFGTEVRLPVEANLQFLRQQTSSIRQEISSLRSVQGAPASAGSEKGLTSEMVLTALCKLDDKLSSKLDLMSGLLQESCLRTRAASTINMDDLSTLQRCLGVKVLPEEEGGVTLEALLRAETGGGESFWDEDTYELQRKDKYMQQFRNMTRTCRDVLWKDASRMTFRTTFTNAPFPVIAKNDLVLSLRRFQSMIEVGAILGVEIKRNLSWTGLHQAEVEFYVWSNESLFPFIQLITDMERGGVAIYSTGGSDVRLRTLGSMEALWDFVSSLVKSLPPDAGKDDSEGRFINPEMLPAPSRKRFRSRDLGMGSTGPQAGSSSIGRQMAFWSMIAAYNNNLGDVANLPDLDCFDLEAVH